MAEITQPETPAPRRQHRRLQAAIGVLALALAVLAGWYLTSPRFNAYVRARLVSEIERATGGRVEMKALRWNLSRLTFEVDDLTIHGLEAANEVPYAHVDRLVARAKIISFWQRDIGFHLLELHHPVIHLITYQDGSTNQPAPKVGSQSGKPGNAKPANEAVFDLAIARAEVRDGVVLLNDRPIPFDFSGSGVHASMTLSEADRRYDGSVHVDKIDAQLKDMRPISAVMDAQISLFPRSVQVRSLNISTGRSQAQANGTIEDFNRPHITLSYVGTVSMAELAGVLRVPEVRGGTAEVKGQGRFDPGTFLCSGVLAIKQLEYHDGNIELRNFAADADYNLDPTTLTLDKIAARAFEGHVTGSAVVRNWQSTPLAAKADATNHVPANHFQQGSAHLTLAGLSVSELARSISSKDLPLAQMNLVGSASGDVSASWKESITNAAAEFAIDVAPPTQPTADQLPVTAHARGAVAAGSNRVQLAEFSAVTRATHITASGTLGQRTSNLKLALTSTDLGEFKPLLALLTEDEFPVAVHGSVAFDGTVAGTIKVPNVAGHVAIRDFDSVLTTTLPTPLMAATVFRHASAESIKNSPLSAPEQAKLKATRIHWDALDADLQFSPSQLTVHNGILRRGAAQLNFDGTTALTKARFTDASMFNARLDLRNADITDVQSLIGLNYPVTGTINLIANVSGSQKDPRGQGRVVITNAVAYGESIRQFSSDLRFADQEAQLTNVDLAHNGSHLTGAAAYNLERKTFRFNLSSPGIDLASVHELRSRIPVTGTLAFTAQGSGTAEQPVINAHVRLSKMVSAGEQVGDLVADAVTTGDTMKITGRSNFRNSDLRIDGTVRLRNDFPAQLTVQANQLDIDPLLRSFVKGQLTAHSRVAGVVEARGPLRNPRLMTVNGAINQLSVEVEQVAIRNDGPIEFSLENQLVTIRRMRLVGDNTELTGSGTIQLAGARHIDIHADGNVNMRLLQTSDIRSAGNVIVNARVAGTLSQPAFFGTLKIENGALSYIDLPNGLSDITGTLAFNQDRLQIQQLTAKTGGGTLDLGGFITYGRSVTFNITAKAKDMRLRYPPGVSSVADADLRLTGSLKGSLLSGDITVTKFGINPHFDFALYLAQVKQSPQGPAPDSPLNNLRFDVHITSTPELQVQTALGKISGNADLRVRGSGTRPTLLGRASIIEGNIFFTGTKYHIERGDITFSNPVRIEPVVDMEATTTVRNYDITLGFHGRLDALSINYRSDPPLSSNDIIQLLAFGRTQSDITQPTTTQQTIAESASNQILSQALNLAVSNRVQKLFGNTRVKVDPNIGGAENNPSGAKVTIEQQVANNVTLTYITDVTRSTQQIIQVEYNINRNLSLTAIRDQNGVVGVDIRLRQRKK